MNEELNYTSFKIVIRKRFIKLNVTGDSIGGMEVRS